MVSLRLSVIAIAVFVVVVLAFMYIFTDTTEDLDNTPVTPYNVATSETFCQALPEGIWFRKLADGASGKSAVAPHGDEDTWAADSGKCGKGSPPDGVTSPIPQADTYDLSAVTGKQGGKWVRFNGR